MLPHRLRQTLRLANGHNIGFANYGSVKGRPVIYLHGTPSSRLETGMWHELCTKLDISLVVPDRPGMGLSTHQPGRTILDYPSEIIKLADHLGWNRFSVLGGSGGAPYVLACALCLSASRLDRIGVIAGSGPPEAGTKGVPILGRLAARLLWPYPRLMGRILKTELAYTNNPDPKVYEAVIKRRLLALNAADKAACERDLEWIVAGCREAVAQGSEGPARDLYLMSQPWGFEIGQISRKGIQLWCGSLDRNTPPAMSRYMAERLPESRLNLIEGLTHYTIFTEEKMQQIFRDFLVGT
jgi:pimeloyl-ACP methyl ester carboxylesterase